MKGTQVYSTTRPHVATPLALKQPAPHTKTDTTVVRVTHLPVQPTASQLLAGKRPYPEYTTYHDTCDLNALQLWAICNEEHIEVYDVYKKQVVARFTPEHYQYPKQKGESADVKRNDLRVLPKQPNRKH